MTRPHPPPLTIERGGLDLSIEAPLHRALLYYTMLYSTILYYIVAGEGISLLLIKG